MKKASGCSYQHLPRLIESNSKWKRFMPRLCETGWVSLSQSQSKDTGRSSPAAILRRPLR